MSQIVSKDGFVPDLFAGVARRTPQDHRPGAALRLGPEADVTALAAQIETASMIEIGFDSFADGRGFSLAALIRRSGFGGHLRASGPLLVDQLRAALRAGFDDIELPDAMAKRQPEAQWRAVPMGRGYRDQVFDL
ncbi:DUF934 domain-containing protein [uncultured Thioclava sp.]|uniref:DUF934 domain-containing protein n=1 Tax=Thioclava arctica TaxID=3238301 RepID=A0ABV3TNL8_9RHOB|nr:DUF934 domain-containing protein [uncultured Thioclava sp.]